MPLYEFECPNCSNTEEVIESFRNSEKEHTCSKCRAKMKKRISPSSVRIEGYSYKNSYSKN